MLSAPTWPVRGRFSTTYERILNGFWNPPARWNPRGLAKLLKTKDRVWRRGWDSNPRALSDNTLSRRARYDHFGTSPTERADDLLEDRAGRLRQFSILPRTGAAVPRDTVRREWAPFENRRAQNLASLRIANRRPIRAQRQPQSTKWPRRPESALRTLRASPGNVAACTERMSAGNAQALRPARVRKASRGQTSTASAQASVRATWFLDGFPDS